MGARGFRSPGSNASGGEGVRRTDLLEIRSLVANGADWASFGRDRASLGHDCASCNGLTQALRSRVPPAVRRRAS